MGIEIANDAEFQWKNRKNMKNLIDTRKNIVYNKNKRRRHRYGKGTIAENRSSLCVVSELERNGREYEPLHETLEQSYGSTNGTNFLSDSKELVEMKEKETCYQRTGQTQAMFACSKFEPRY